MANVKISALPSWTGSPSDLRWFVMNNSGETGTFKFSGYTTPIVPANGSNSVRSLYFTSNKNLSPYGVLIGGLDTNEISSTGNYNTIIGGEGSTITAGEDNGIFAAKNSTIGSSASYSSIVGGRTHTANHQFAFIGGGAQNTAGYLSAAIGGFNLNATNQSAIFNGENNTSTAANGGIFGGSGNNASGNRSVIIGGATNTLTNSDSAIIASQDSTNGGIHSTIASSQLSVIGSTLRAFIGATYECRINNGIVSSIIGGYQNIITADSYDTILNGYDNKINGGSYNQILNGQSNTVGSTSTNNVTIIGGESNTINRANNSSIINSKNSSQNTSNLYNTSGVTMVSCVSTDITNSNNSVFLGLSGRTIVGSTSADNTTYVEKLYIYGNTRYETTIVNNPGTININVFEESHVEINASGGTYDLVINPSPSQEGTPELTLLINYISSGATITFNQSGSSQWRWSAGTPSFTPGTRSIIKVAAWDTNDVWEISRSMNMT